LNAVVKKEKACAKYSVRVAVEVLGHEGNRGKGVALRSAFLCAKDLRPDVVVVLDADGQHDPNEIPRLVEPILGR